MKRIVYEVPRWDVFLGRDARCLDTSPSDRDDTVLKFEDELFDRIYAGDPECLPEADQDPKLRTWAGGVHAACDKLPAFSRLASECRGEPILAGTAVETLMAVLKPQVPDAPDQKKPDNIRRSINSGCEKASQAVEELRDAMDGLAEVGLGVGTGSQIGAAMVAKTIRSLASKLKSDARLKQIALQNGRWRPARHRRRRVIPRPRVAV